MSDDASLQAMYPTMSSAPVELAPAPPAIAELRAQNDVSYPTMPVERYNAVAFDAPIDVPPEKAAALKAEVANLFNDINAPEQDVSYALGKARQYARTPPTPAQLSDMKAEAAAQLKAIYGDRAHAALMDARALVNRDPRFKKFVDSAGLGDDPGMITRLAALARSERSRGRLK